MNRELIDSKIKSLVLKFEANKYHYLSKNYLEEEVKIDFINPFFEALGWDIRNTKGLSPYERDVVVEKGETLGRPDYNFRIDGQTKFFIEAKAPHEPLHKINHVLQAKSYAWNTKNVFIVLLTDFEEFRLFDATIKPDSKHPDQGLIFELTYDQYLDNLDKLILLSKEEVEKGSLDKLILKDSLSKRLRKPVDEVFLEDISKWREELAKDIYKQNIKELEDRADEKKVKIQVKILNEAVQKILDRLIFIRIAEDRKIIEPKSLLDEVEWWKAGGKRRDLHRRLIDRFMGWNQDFNGEILKPSPCDVLKIDSHLLAKIIDGLYFPKCPYLFDVIGVELLGSIYERYLGKTIRATPKRVRIEEKPEVRKAGGIYYTPQYIVDYIVKNTVYQKLKGKTPKQIEKIKILDPACGSGSFLIAAYQTIIDYYLQYYEKHPEESEQGKLFPDIVADFNGTKRLSIEKKAQILRNNIFGVDIDPQAVEIAMMSLYLKCLDGEKNLPRKKELLPSLAKNIRCGNSLISYDIYDQLDLFDEEEKERINPFDWNSKSTGFGQIMKNGGFDIVIGNPPWGAELSHVELNYLRIIHKEIVVRMVDSYMYFIYKSTTLLRKNGLFGMILPSTLLTQSDMALLRLYLIKNYDINTVINLGEKVFGLKVLNTSSILIFKKSKIDTREKEMIVSDLRNLVPEEKENEIIKMKNLRKKEWKDAVTIDPNYTFFTLNLDAVRLVQKLSRNHKKFINIIDGKIQRGISPDYAPAFIIENDLARKLSIENDILKPVVLGKNISRYNEIESSSSIIYLTHNDNIKKYPYAHKYLSRFRNNITCKEALNGKHPLYSLHRPRNPSIFSAPKFIGLTTTRKICVVLDKIGYYATDALYLFKVKITCAINHNYILGVLNSKIFNFLYQVISQNEQRVIPQIKAVKLYDLPFPIPSMKEERGLHYKIVDLVNKIIDLNKKKNTLPLSSKREKIEREIQITDEKIDELVYELYGINEEERKVIEEEI